jgi:hypothetical protein
MRRVLLLLAATAAGCRAAAPPDDWAMVGVVNGEDGAVVVWRRAWYTGGGFNGFDRDPVLVSRATFRAWKVAEFGDGTAAAPVPMDFEYRIGGEGDSHPAFRFRGRQLVPDMCGTLPWEGGGCSGVANDDRAVDQLGGRAEEMSLAGADLVLGPPASPRCRVAMPGWMRGRASVDDRSHVAYFPRAELVYVATEGSAPPRLAVSHRCGAFRELSAHEPALRALTSAGGQRPEVVDLAPTGDVDRPALLLQWDERHDGGFRQRMGVLELARDSLARALPEGHGQIIGFWQSSPSRVAWNSYGEWAGADRGTLTFVVHDVETGATRSFPQAFALR